MKTHFIVVVLSMALVTLPAQANTYACVGTVSNVSVANNGTVTFALNVTGMPFISACTLGTTAGNGWTADACKAVYARLMAAQLSGQTLAVYFNDTLTCATQPSWSLNNTLYT